ncbi:hypothetical protein RB195_021592 [Necator americanus]|uniref:Uncharacterized protein n=1 Tax=Necator americanus TaxID=51031 RepID=A0ABR1EBS5_NECAM
MPRTSQDLRRRYFYRVRIIGDCSAEEKSRIVIEPEAPLKAGQDVIHLRRRYFYRVRIIGDCSAEEKSRIVIEPEAPLKAGQDVIPEYSTNSIEKPASKPRIKKRKKTTVRHVDNGQHLWMKPEVSESKREPKKIEEEQDRRRDIQERQREQAERRQLLEELRKNNELMGMMGIQKRPKKVVRKRPYRREQAPYVHRKAKPRKELHKQPKATRNRVQATGRGRVPKKRKKSNVVLKRPWAYVGDPTLRAYRTREQTHLSDFHF